MYRIFREKQKDEPRVYRKKKTKKKQRKKLIKLFRIYHGNRCTICEMITYQRKIKLQDELTIEHVIGRKENSDFENKWENLVPVCNRCNHYRSFYQEKTKSKVINFTMKEAKKFFKSTYFDVFTGSIEMHDKYKNSIRYSDVETTIRHYGINSEYLKNERLDFYDTLVDQEQLNKIFRLINELELDAMEIKTPYVLMKKKLSAIGHIIKINEFSKIKKKYERRYIYERKYKNK
jgi:5-methylcytosine-specific restriction endonuclease McrA